MKPIEAKFDFERGFVAGKTVQHTQRYFVDIKDIFDECDPTMEAKNPLCYEVFEVMPKDGAGDISYGSSILYPGRVKDQFLMTRGHIHVQKQCGEVYLCTAGEGYLLLQNADGQCEEHFMQPGVSIFSPGEWAHRTINTGDTPFVCFYSYSSKAGHDYEATKISGFGKKIIAEGDSVVVVPTQQNGQV